VHLHARALCRREMSSLYYKASTGLLFKLVYCSLTCRGGTKKCIDRVRWLLRSYHMHVRLNAARISEICISPRSEKSEPAVICKVCAVLCKPTEIGSNRKRTVHVATMDSDLWLLCTCWWVKASSVSTYLLPIKTT
jgi:hypothetical protein